MLAWEPAWEPVWEPVSGFEPLTCRLQDGCSAN
jgi:ABC-type cobalt transport system substrate-binding protein